MPAPCEVCAGEEKAKTFSKISSHAYQAAHKIYLAGKEAGMECGRSGAVVWIGTDKISEIVQEAIDESTEEPCEWYQEAKNQAEKASAIQDENQRLREALKHIAALLFKPDAGEISRIVDKSLKGTK